jgi:hypothetical protein
LLLQRTAALSDAAPALVVPLITASSAPLSRRKLADTRALAASLNSGLTKMNDAKADIGKMKVGGWN